MCEDANAKALNKAFDKRLEQKINPAARYIAIQAEIKALEEEKELLRIQLMAIVDTPPEGYTITVVNTSTDRLEGLKAIRDKSESLWKALHEVGAVKKVESTRVTVKEVKDRGVV